VLLGFTGEAGVGVRAEDGALLWRYTRPSTGNAINVTTPVFANDQVFYSASYGIGGGALRISPAGASEAGPPTSAAPSGTTAASTPGAPNPSGTLWAGEGGSRGLSAEEAWFETRLQNHHGGVVVHEGTMYAFFGPALTSVDFESGQVHWRARSVGKGSLVMADGKLFLLGERNQVGLAVATPNGYEERGRFEIEDRGDFTWAHPVVAGGALYIRDQESLTSYDVAASEAAAETGASE